MGKKKRNTKNNIAIVLVILLGVVGLIAWLGLAQSSFGTDQITFGGFCESIRFDKQNDEISVFGTSGEVKSTWLGSISSGDNFLYGNVCETGQPSRSTSTEVCGSNDPGQGMIYNEISNINANTITLDTQTSGERDCNDVGISVKLENLPKGTIEIDCKTSITIHNQPVFTECGVVSGGKTEFANYLPDSTISESNSTIIEVEGDVTIYTKVSHANKGLAEVTGDFTYTKSLVETEGSDNETEEDNTDNDATGEDDEDVGDTPESEFDLTRYAGYIFVGILILLVVIFFVLRRRK